MMTVGGCGAAAGVDAARPDDGADLKRVWRVRSSLPVVEQIPVTVDDTEQRRIAALADQLRRHDPVLAPDDGNSAVRQGVGDGPALIFEDHGEIPLFTTAAPSPLEYRSLLLAEEGDVFALGGHRIPDFEVYARDELRLGDVTVLPRPAGSAPRGTGGVPPTTAAGAAMGCPLPDALRTDPASLARLVRLARERGSLTVIPYLSTAGTWRLAAAVADEAGVDVFVLGPPPALAARVNDKSWFSRRVADVLGPDAIPETGWVADAFELTTTLQVLAKRHRRLVVKMPDSAGGVGNVVLDSAVVAHLDHDRLLAHVWEQTGRAGRGWSFPLLVGAWDDPVFDSPSVQLWVPQRGDGLPVVEGIFSQVLKGARGAFVGAAPTRLGGEWQQRLAGEAVRLALLFQELGYFGRCSFDAVLAGAGLESAAVHWVDANGRWGGVSIALTAANRLVGDWQRRPFVIVQRSRLQMPPRPLPAILDELGSANFRPSDGRTGTVVLAPCRLVAGNGMNLMVLAGDVATAEADAEAVKARLLGTLDEDGGVSAVA
jgi:Pre ATP-grasp domain